MTYPTGNIVNTIASGGSSTNPFITHFSSVDPTSSVTQFPIQTRWVNTTDSSEFILANLTSMGGYVQANWIQLGSGTVNLETLTGNTGGTIYPSSYNINVLGDTTSLTITGNPSTHTLTAKVILPAGAHSVLVGETTSISGITPSATSGIPLVSQGSSSDPAFSTAVVAGGGTSATSFTAYAPICGGTTTTGALQSASSGISNSGYVLTSTGSSSLPTWQAAGGSGIITLNGDTGSATGSTVTLTMATNYFGGTTSISGSGSHLYFNSCDGGNHNCIIGQYSFQSNVNSSSNAGIGYNVLSAMTGGGYNLCLGFEVANNLLSGQFNSILGYGAAAASGTQYTSNESNNILINNEGVTGDANTLRIGAGTGSSSAHLNQAFISGINGVTASNPVMVTINSSTDQMGVVASGDNGVLISSSSGVPSWLANGTAGYVLTANSGAPPSWHASPSQGFITVNTQVFTTSGTYTPTSGMTYCTIYCTGAGGGGGCSNNTTAGQSSVGSGGAGGGTAIKTVTSSTIGSSQTVTIGAGGAGASANAGAGDGAAGGTSSVGSIVTATGGNGGVNGVAGTLVATQGNDGGVGSSGDVNIYGQPGAGGFGSGGTQFSGASGGSFFGGGIRATIGSSAGGNGLGYGSGGGGSTAGASGTTESGQAGGNGIDGIVYIIEYII